MLIRTLSTLLVVLAFAPQTTDARPQVPAQPSVPPQRPDDRADRRIARLMDRLREEMWNYRQELEFFRNAPAYEQLANTGTSSVTRRET